MLDFSTASPIGHWTAGKPPLLHIFQSNGVLLGIANATPNRAGNGNRFVDALAGTVSVNQEWLFLSVRFAHSSATKLTDRVRRPFTMPAFHGMCSLSGRVKVER
jgi:hypothetical protein